MKKIFNYFAIAISAFAMLSCNKEAAPVVDCNDGDRDRDATIVSSGYTITYAMATAN